MYSVNEAVSPSIDTRWAMVRASKGKGSKNWCPLTWDLRVWDDSIDPRYEQTRRKSYPMRRERAADVMELT